MTSESIDPSNPVVSLCAEGIAAEGTPEVARELFARAWAARRDDYDAAIAAHYLARHQPNDAETLRWNALAVRHAEAVPDGRTAPFLASLYLNLGDAQAKVGDVAQARDSVKLAEQHLESLPEGGYRDMLAMGIARLRDRLA